VLGVGRRFDSRLSAHSVACEDGILEAGQLAGYGVMQLAQGARDRRALIRTLLWLLLVVQCGVLDPAISVAEAVAIWAFEHVAAITIAIEVCRGRRLVHFTHGSERRGHNVAKRNASRSDQ